MNRLFVVAGVLALGIFATSSFVRAEEDAPKTKAIMKACFGKGGLCGTCIGAGKKGDWDKASKVAKDFCKCIEGLPKGEPKKGDKEAYAEAAKEFVKKVKALDEAVEAKDEKKFNAAVKGVTSSCMGCHKAHR